MAINQACTAARAMCSKVITAKQVLATRVSIVFYVLPNDLFSESFRRASYRADGDPAPTLGGLRTGAPCVCSAWGEPGVRGRAVCPLWPTTHGLHSCMRAVGSPLGKRLPFSL